MQQSERRLNNKVALIFGAGCVGQGWGIGKAISVLFARHGARIAAIDINLKAASETANLVEQEGAEAIAIQADVASSQEVEQAVNHALETFGRIDTLINNVGVGQIGGPVEISEAEWDRIMEINIKGPLLACKYALPHMEKTGGSIISISSIAARRFVGYPHLAYSTSKAALEQMSRVVALEYASKGIRSNCIVPGLIDTPRIEKTVASAFAEGDYQTARKKRDAQCPTGAMGSAWDIAHAAVYLASDDSAYVTGTEILVDGGLTAKYS